MPRTRTWFACSPFVACFVACSPVDGGIEPDAPVADTTPPAIVQSNPSDMGRRFSVIQPITVVFDEAIDPSSVSSASITLTYDSDELLFYFSDENFYRGLGPGMGQRAIVPGTVTFDEVSSTLRFEPKAPLPYGKRFTLSLTQVKDVAGNELTTTVTFMTFVNGARRDRTYNTQLQPQPYVDRRLDANGFLADHLRRTDPGTDTDWYTDDDIVSDAVQLTFHPDGRLDREWTMLAGMDTELGTSDDTISYGLTYAYDTMSRLEERIGHDIGDAGDDMMFGTPDDLIALITKLTYTGERVTHWVHYVSPGTNMTWRNSDDLCSLQYDYVYDAQGHRTRESLRDCGANQMPEPTDPLVQYFEYAYDANHALVRRALRTPTDLYTYLETYTTDANGLVTEMLRHESADGMGDPIGRTKTKYDANKQPIQVETYGAGMDTRLGTNDDIVIRYTVTTYDSLGNRVTARTYDSGPDAIAFTGDDRPIADFEYDTMH